MPYATLHTKNTHCLRLWVTGHFKATEGNWHVKVWDWGISLYNAVLTVNHPLGVEIVCLGFLWILRNLDKMLLKI